MRALFLGSLFAGLLLTGCSKIPNAETAGEAPRVVQNGPAVTESEATDFGKALEKAVKEGNRNEITQALRITDLAERCVSDFGLSAKEKKAFVQGASTAEGGVASQLLTATKKGGYRFLRTRELEGRRRVLFRLISEEGAVTYHDVVVVRYPDGKIAAEDIYLAATGEMLSTTMRRTVIPLFKSGQFGSRLSDSEKLFVKHEKEIQSVTVSFRNGKHQEALATFQKLPAEVQKIKFLEIVAISAAGQCDEPAYINLLDKFQQNHPGDPASDLLSIDHYYLKKDYAATRTVTQRLEASIGGDPYLKMLRGSLYYEEKKYKEAIVELEKASAEEPGLDNLDNSLIMSHLKLNQPKGVLKWLKHTMTVNHQEIPPDEIKVNPEYATFITTPEFTEYQTWFAAQKKE